MQAVGIKNGAKQAILLPDAGRNPFYLSGKCRLTVSLPKDGELPYLCPSIEYLLKHERQSYRGPMRDAESRPPKIAPEKSKSSKSISRIDNDERLVCHSGCYG